MAGIFDSITRGMEATRTRAATGTTSFGMIPPLGGFASATGLVVSQATAMMVSAVYACVERRAMDVARCPPSLYTLDPETRARVYVTEHPVLPLFDRPNRQQTWFEFVHQLMVGYVLRQNAYAVMLRDGRGNIRELVPINPDLVTVLESADGSIFYNVNRQGLWQIAMLRDYPTAVPAEDMLHIRGLTFNTLVGVSTVGLARDTIGVAMGQGQQAARWIGNGARPSVVLKTPKTLSDDAAKRLKAQWDEFTSGIQNTGRTAVLEEGLEAQALQLTAADLDFLKQRNYSDVEICRFMGVPPHKVFADTGVRANNQNLAQQDQDYVNSTVSRDLECFEGRLRITFDLDREGIFVDMDETALLRADILTRTNVSRLRVLSSLATPDEERLAEGRAPKGGRAGELQYPANTAAVGSEVTGTAPDGAGRPGPGEAPDPGFPTSGVPPENDQAD